MSGIGIPDLQAVPEASDGQQPLTRQPRFAESRLGIWLVWSERPNQVCLHLHPPSRRFILVPALQIACGSVAVAHNHPSGIPEPSRADRVVTVALREACTLVGVQLLDHIIVTDTGYWSFRDADGWIE